MNLFMLRLKYEEGAQRQVVLPIKTFVRLLEQRASTVMHW